MPLKSYPRKPTSALEMSYLLLNTQPAKWNSNCMLKGTSVGAALWRCLIAYHWMKTVHISTLTFHPVFISFFFFAKTDEYNVGKYNFLCFHR